VAKVPISFEGVEDYVRLWATLKSTYVDLRGFTVGANTKAIPRTTVSDVLQLATSWTRELKRASGRPGFDREKDRWRDVMAQILLAEGADLEREYPQNDRFWDATGSLAIYLDSTRNVPSRWDLVVESVEETIDELPGTLEHGATTAARAVAKGSARLLGGLAAPLVIGALAVGVLLLLRK
jgi:hypothetical protein